MTRSSYWILISGFAISAVLTFVIVEGGRAGDDAAQAAKKVELLNVSYDPTRELWREVNATFINDYQAQTGVHVSITQSHGGSSSQARAVIDGLEADVVTLALPSDTDAIRKAGLIAEGWQDRLPKQSTPYYSTIVFVVRQDNPRGIHDWSDLVRPGIQVITPSPKTSGNGKLSFLAAWGSVLIGGGSQEDARKYVTELYRHAPVLDSGARGATTTFAQRKIGDVHLTWENEARLEVQESGGSLEIVYPSSSIKAEPPVAWVDANVQRHGTQAVAEAYLKFVYSTAGQEILARHFYRPIDAQVRHRYAKNFPEIRLFSINDISEGWQDAQQRFFADGAVFDEIYSNQAK